MGFVLGNADFDRHRRDRQAHDAEVARIDTLNMARDMANKPVQQPFDAYANQGAPMTPNQVGPTPAQLEAMRRAEAAKIASGAYGPVDDRGDRPGTDRDLEAPRAGLTAAYAPDVDPVINRLRSGLSLGQYDAPATNFAARLLGGPEDFEARQVAIKTNEWLASSAAKQYFTQNPSVLAAIQAKKLSPMDAYLQAVGGSRPLPGGGQSVGLPTALAAPVPTPAPQQVAPAQAASAGLTTPQGEQILANNKANPVTAKDRPVVKAGGSMAKQIATKAPEKIKEPPFNMPYSLRAQEINTLMAQRQGLTRMAIVTAGNPASAAFLQVRTDLDLNRAAIENMAQTQALNLLGTHNDPRQLNAILSRQYGRDIVISPNSDGTLRMHVDGKMVGDRINKTKLVHNMRLANSTKFREQIAQAKTAQIAKRDAALLDMHKLVLGKRWDRMTQLEKVQAEAEGKFFKGEEGDIWTVENGKKKVMRVSEEESELTGDPVMVIKSAIANAGPAEGLSTAPSSGVDPALKSFFASFK